MITISTISRTTRRTALAIVGLALAYGSAQAQPTTSGLPDNENQQAEESTQEESQSSNTGLSPGGRTTARPWTMGVSPHQQSHAEALYQEGNRDFTNGFFAAAVAKYQAALQHWNHPGIHYNLALALISLDRPIEAYESIVAALGHGVDGLHPDEYQRALDYRRVLRQRIAEVEVVCDEPGAAVTLDGKPLFTGPGRARVRVLPGKHQIVATKRGYLVTTKALELAAATRKRFTLHLLAAYQSSTQVQSWPTWPQWTMTGLGLGAGAVAAIMHLQFRAETDRLNAWWRRNCSEGCTPYPEALNTLRERLEWRRRIAYGGYATAGTFLTLGAVLAYLSHPEAVETGVRGETVQISAGGPAGSAGISVNINF
jgi:tetratricopeptide (TPR) repeat protein